MIDFQDIKARATYNDVLSLLALQGKRVGEQWRGKCPACKTDNERALALTAGKGAYCHAAQKGGDIIWLVSHILNIGARDAAQKIADHIGHVDKMVTVPQEPATVPEAVKEKATPTASNVLTPLTYLVYDHEQVKGLGLDAETARTLGIGFAPKGLMRGRVAVPIYHKGELVGYLGIAKDADVKLPTNLQEKTRAR